jgi:hypothetical protein
VIVKPKRSEADIRRTCPLSNRVRHRRLLISSLLSGVILGLFSPLQSTYIPRRRTLQRKTSLSYEGRIYAQMAESQLSQSTDTPTPLRATAHSRSRATSSSSIRTALSIHSSPLKVAAISSTSQPELSQDYASAQIKHTSGEAVPELQKTLSDLDLHTQENGRSSSNSSRERTPRPDPRENGHARTPDAVFRPEVAATPKRNPLGSRRSTISASATTTSLNLDTADPVTASSSTEGASGMLSKSAGSRGSESAARSRRRNVGSSSAENGRGDSAGSPERENERSLQSAQTTRNGSRTTGQGAVEQAQHHEPCSPVEKHCKSFLQKMSSGTLTRKRDSG